MVCTPPAGPARCRLGGIYRAPGRGYKMEFQVQYRYERRWVVLARFPTRNEARDDIAQRISFFVADGFKHGDVVRDFRVRGVTTQQVAA